MNVSMKKLSKKKLVTSVLLMLIAITACDEQIAGGDKKVLNSRSEQQLSAALAQAKANNDLRLFATKGRRLVIPGIEVQQYEKIKSRCGVKYIENSGDVLKDQQDKNRRRQNYQFAVDYNQKIITLCLNQVITKSG
jgi:hypothetical protein